MKHQFQAGGKMKLNTLPQIFRGSLIGVLFGLGAAHSQMVKPNPLSPLKTKKVMVLEGGNTTGDHAQGRDNCWKNMQAMATSVGFSIVKGNPKTLTEATIAGIDIIVFNYFFETQLEAEFPKTGKAAFMSWLKKGKKGYVGYHTAGANQWPAEWPGYQDSVTSMRYDLHGSGTPQGTVTKTTDPAIANHPIMEGLPATFNAEDEWYEYLTTSKIFDTAAHVKVMYNLANAKEINRAPNPIHPVAWFREDAFKSRYFYSTFIHGGDGANSDWFKSILLRALEYVAGDPSTPIIKANGDGVITNANLSYITNSRSLQVNIGGDYRFSILTMEGRSLYSAEGNGLRSFSPPPFQNPGLYTVRVQSKSVNFTQRIMVY